jgi:hypothetical protein
MHLLILCVICWLALEHSLTRFSPELICLENAFLSLLIALSNPDTLITTVNHANIDYLPYSNMTLQSWETLIPVAICIAVGTLLYCSPAIQTSSIPKAFKATKKSKKNKKKKKAKSNQSSKNDLTFETPTTQTPQTLKMSKSKNPAVKTHTDKDVKIEPVVPSESEEESDSETSEPQTMVWGILQNRKPTYSPYNTQLAIKPPRFLPDESSNTAQSVRVIKLVPSAPVQSQSQPRKGSKPATEVLTKKQRENARKQQRIKEAKLEEDKLIEARRRAHEKEREKVRLREIMADKRSKGKSKGSSSSWKDGSESKSTGNIWD